MSQHEWDAWAQAHGQPTRHEEWLDRQRSTYHCHAEACKGLPAHSGSAMAHHLEADHHISLPTTPRQGAVKFLDGPDFHAIETEWYYGDVCVVERKRTG